jgi:hypothetical protein
LPGSEAAKSAITDLNLIGLRLQEPTTLYPYLTPTFLSPVFSSPILTAYDETLKVATIQIQNKDATRTIVYTVDLARDEPQCCGRNSQRLATIDQRFDVSTMIQGYHRL